MKTKTLIVISDIHIGAGELDGFSEEIETHFCDFLKMLGEKSSPVELIINGDFLEFIQAPPWEGSELESKSSDGMPLCFTEEQSITKLEAIYNAHRNTFYAIKEFLKSNSENNLTVIPGNHDVDFFWEKVRKKFKLMIGDGDTSFNDKIYFHLEQVYRPNSILDIWIEHGHQYDPLNSFFVGDIPIWSEGMPPIFRDERGRKRLFECIGTRFLIKYLNGVNSSYPFVKNVKPFSFLFKTFGISVFHPGYGGIKAAFAVWKMLQYLNTLFFKYQNDFLEESTLVDPRIFLKDLESGLTINEKSILKKRINKYLDFSQPLEFYIRDMQNACAVMDILSEHLEIMDGFCLSSIDSNLSSSIDDGFTLGSSKYILENETTLLLNRAQTIFNEEGRNTVIVMGHTHESINKLNLNYYNTGCWTRNYNHDLGEKLSRWSLLKEDSYNNFPFQFNYIEIVPDANIRLKFKTFRECLGY